MKRLINDRVSRLQAKNKTIIVNTHSVLTMIVSLLTVIHQSVWTSILDKDNRIESLSLNLCFYKVGYIM